MRDTEILLVTHLRASILRPFLSHIVVELIDVIVRMRLYIQSFLFDSKWPQEFIIDGTEPHGIHLFSATGCTLHALHLFICTSSGGSQHTQACQKCCTSDSPVIVGYQNTIRNCQKEEKSEFHDVYHEIQWLLRKRGRLVKWSTKLDDVYTWYVCAYICMPSSVCYGN